MINRFLEVSNVINEKHKLIQMSARKFAETEIGPQVEWMEEEGIVPREIFKKAGELGFIGSYIPTEYGGGGGDFFTEAIIKEEITKVNAGVGASITVNSLIYGNPVFCYGTEEQKRKYLIPVLKGEKCASWALTEPDSGSDALSIKTSSLKVGSHYIINGSKTFITNAPIADFIVVNTRTYGSGIEGGTAFILERNTPGLSFGEKINKVGLRPSPTGELFFEDVKVDESHILGEVGRGFINMFESLNIERIIMAISSVGIAQACLEASKKYATERKQFGKNISNFQLIKSKIAEMETDIEISRSYTYQVLWMIQNRVNPTREASIAKLFASQMAQKCSLYAFQIHGGYGVTKKYPVERYLMDSIYLTIGGGTSEIQKLIIAREVFKQ